MKTEDRDLAEHARPVLPARAVKQALKFLCMPEKLWPPGVHLAVEVLDLREQYKTYLRKLHGKLMRKSVQVGQISKTIAAALSAAQLEKGQYAAARLSVCSSIIA